MGQHLLEICYLIASVTFIVGLKMMSNPKTARKGNLLAAGGMTLAILGTIFLYNNAQTSRESLKIILIFTAIAIGTVIGWLTAKRVQMTKMPELVSMFNGMGGACAALIGLMEFHHSLGNIGALIPTVLGMVIGSVSFAGSVIVQTVVVDLLAAPTSAFWDDIKNYVRTHDVSFDSPKFSGEF